MWSLQTTAVRPLHSRVAYARFRAPAGVDLVSKIEAEDVVLPLPHAGQRLNVNFLRAPDCVVRIETRSSFVEWRQKEPATQLPGKRRDHCVQIALTHECEQLMQPLQMQRTHPLWIRLKVRPDQQNAQMIRAQSRDRIQVSLDRVGVPFIPAEPPILRWCIVHAKTMSIQRQTWPQRDGVQIGDSHRSHRFEMYPVRSCRCFGSE